MSREWKIPEQIVEDRTLGLSFQFEVLPSGRRAMRIFGADLPYGNREVIFDEAGDFDGIGVAPAGPKKPTWMFDFNS
jgi:hypothetical protein